MKSLLLFLIVCTYGALCPLELDAADTVQVRILNAKMKKVGETRLNPELSRAVFTHVPSGEFSVELRDGAKRKMIVRGDLNDDGTPDCVIASPDSLKSSTSAQTLRGPFYIIKEWTNPKRTIPCINEEDAHTKFSTATRTGADRSNVMVLSIRITGDTCQVDILSWAM